MPKNNLLKRVRSFPLFSGMASEQVSMLLAGGKFRSVADRESLFSMGSLATQFAIVAEGLFKVIRIDRGGDEIILNLAEEGELIGALVMPFPNSTYPASVLSIGCSSAFLLPRQVYKATWMANPEIQTRLNAALYSRMCTLQGEKAAIRQSLRGRVCSMLLRLKRPSEGASARSVSDLSRQELASVVGCSVEAMIRCLGSLSREGAIRLNAKTIEIIDEKRLELYSAGI